MSELRIGFISFGDPRKRTTWSGIHHSIYERLAERNEVEWLDPNRSNLKLIRLAHRAVSVISRRPVRSYHTRAFARALAHNLGRYDLDQFDLVFCIGSSNLSFLEADVPIVHLADATYAQMIGYYDGFDMGGRRNREANDMQRLAYENSTQLILMSRWAAESARNDYGVPEDKINVLRFGANQNVPDVLPERHENGTLRLLFVGKEWERKGGAKAVDALSALRRRGIDATLTMVGCKVPSEFEGTPGLTVVPFVENVAPYFRDSDLFILPTRAECAGIVFCEASGYGLPCFATATGGVPDYVEDGVNGYLLSPDATGEDYAERIAAACADPAALAELRQRARDKYERELNWGVWMKGFEVVVKKALSRKA